VSLCPRPLDSIDAEAVASGGEPLFAPDAAQHAAQCTACRASVEAAKAMDDALDRLREALPPLPDLAARVTRLRAFSFRERRTYALWRAPILLCGGLLAGGLALVLSPGLTAGEQAGLSASVLAPVLAFLRTLARWAPELARLAPSGLEALSDALRQEPGLGLAALALLVPSLFGFRRALVRARARR